MFVAITWRLAMQRWGAVSGDQLHSTGDWPSFRAGPLGTVCTMSAMTEATWYCAQALAL